MLDYETLKIVWWLLVGVLLIGFAVMDGHDMGVGTLLPFVGRDDTERRVVINTVGPHWDGNQVWFITGGGAIFAAWPLVYATAFSGFYWAMLAVLWALFFRPVGFDYRSKIADPRWRSTWDWGLFVGGAVPPLIFGVAFGNLLQGVPFHFDANLVPYYTGSFWALLNPFALLCGVVSSAMITFHGGIYLMHRTEGDIQARARLAVLGAGTVVLVGFTAAGVWLWADVPGYAIGSAIDPAGPANPLAKTVVRAPGAWLANYGRHTWMLLAPVLGYAGVLLGMLLAWRGRTLTAFVASSFGIAGIIATPGVSMFPFVMPSSTHPGSSLTAWDSVSSHLTLGIMFWATLIFMPLVVVYTSWAYRVMAGKVTAAYVREHSHSAY
ncbi:cytochrome d ubiquinol oxidase subunit II [Rhodoplanes sp. TEM]|uniref:Cytochrome d ubiquinol oxidase subunit II n=1 Tax=Rhodoplanes tepidamans TaxID=200616 RepID=A0ABT5JDJ0_RHOTP|nr:MULTISPECIES: cytochrome d ubiquinol oxidase subunit II [Rhodoplanes]MDC7787679.1 cytochrome d ubiquinol oxidase subunit II [Rhodoplanes tepidamans]MDC7983053.1 cytochrome d ubiquinol oxidase subunit II [Rhodoplanes sp. TEM]MDQ0356435.1 cytochrome d ubiquinol oxidase subunit II [Rhodoplanes tepidamans]